MNDWIADIGIKQREYFRKFYGANASLLIEDREYRCIVKDISKGGAQLSFDASPPVKIGELVDVQIPFTDGERYMRKRAKVKRLNGNNIGIRFCGSPQDHPEGSPQTIFSDKN